MIKFSKSFIGIIGLIGLISCAPKNAPVELKPDLQKLEVLHRIQELQRTVIAVHDANPTLLPKAKADIAVRFTLAANDIVALDTSWQNKVKALWLTFKKEFTPPTNLLPIWTIVDSLLMGLL